jgi:hypothetical protein
VQPFQATEGWNNIFAELLLCQEKVLIYRTGQEYLALKKNHYCHEKSALSASKFLLSISIVFVLNSYF